MFFIFSALSDPTYNKRTEVYVIVIKEFLNEHGNMLVLDDASSRMITKIEYG